MRLDGPIIDGSLEHSASGYTDELHYIASDVGGDASARRFLVATDPQVPNRGDPHPAGVPGATVQNVSVTAEDRENTIFRVVVSYGGDSDGTADGLQGTGVKGLNISTSTVTKTQRVDRDNNLLIVTYQGPSFQIRQNSVEPAQDVVILSTSGVLEAEYEVSILRATVTVERPLPSLSDNIRFADRTNIGIWSGQPPGTWLILGIDSSIGSNGSHDHQYQLAYLREGWAFRGQINQINGLLPADASEGNGIKHFPLYEDLDFGQLGFEIPT